MNVEVFLAAFCIPVKTSDYVAFRLIGCAAGNLKHIFY